MRDGQPHYSSHDIWSLHYSHLDEIIHEGPAAAAFPPPSPPSLAS